MYYVKLKIPTREDELLCEENAVYKDEGNETLNSASVVIKGLTEELDLQPLDLVRFKVYDDDTLIFNKQMCINSWQMAIDRQINAKIMNYSITLISETKRLEGILLPNIVITNDNVNDYVINYIQHYNEVYGAPHNITVNQQAFNALGFGTKICPNMRWNAPTYRELLNDLCLVCDCIITLVDGQLTPMQISQAGSVWDSDKITYVNKSQSLEDYTSELYSELSNAIDNTDSVNNKYITYRNDEVAYFSETEGGELRIKTERPILEIKKFTINLRVDKTETESEKEEEEDSGNENI